MPGRILRVPAHLCHDKRPWPPPQLLNRVTKHARLRFVRVQWMGHTERVIVCDGEADGV